MRSFPGRVCVASLAVFCASSGLRAAEIPDTIPPLTSSVRQAMQAHVDTVVLPAMRARFPGATVTSELAYDAQPMVPV